MGSVLPFGEVVNRGSHLPSVTMLYIIESYIIESGDAQCVGSGKTIGWILERAIPGKPVRACLPATGPGRGQAGYNAVDKKRV